MKLTQKDIDRFWAKVRKGPGCWEWTAARLGGYGIFQLNKKAEKAHRVSWFLAHGDGPPSSAFVMHKCDNRRCVRPSHLMIGTHADNMKDMVSKGRQAVGDRHGSKTHPESVARGDRNGSRSRPERLMRGEKVNTAKLVADQVREIRLRFSNGENKSELSRRYGVSRFNIGCIINRTTWRHVT